MPKISGTKCIESEPLQNVETMPLNKCKANSVTHDVSQWIKVHESAVYVYQETEVSMV